MRRDSFTLSLDILTDLTMTQREAMRRFARISKRWKPTTAGFALIMGGYLRAEKERRAFESTALNTWCDDGGRA